LDAPELAGLVSSWNRPDLNAEGLLDKLDVNADRRLSDSELTTLAHLSQALFVSPGDGARGSKRASSALDLFGAVVERSNPQGEGRLPPQIVGPAPHFVRLDLDRDGYITRSELGVLQEGSGIFTRVGAVLAALDLDEDGRLSERELNAGFTSGPRQR